MHQHSFSVIISQTFCLASFWNERSFQKGLWLLDERHTITGTTEEKNEGKRKLLTIHLTFSFGVCLETQSDFREQDESPHPLSFPLYLTNSKELPIYSMTERCQSWDINTYCVPMFRLLVIYYWSFLKSVLSLTLTFWNNHLLRLLSTQKKSSSQIPGTQECSYLKQL